MPAPEQRMMAAEVGATVVYPVHGVAEVVGSETRTVAGKAATYLVLAISGESRGGDLRILVREDQFETIGIRPAMSSDDASQVLDVLAVVDPRLSATWSRRFKSHQEKLKSGDVFDLAEVVRNLALRQQERTLGAADKAMYRRARTSLLAELAVTWGVSTDSAAERVDGALRR